MQTAYDSSQRSQTRSNVAQGDGLPEAGDRVAGRDELLSDVTFVFQFEQFAHDRRVVDLLSLIQFAPARISSRVYVADDVLALVQAPDDVSVHDLHVVN